MKISDFLNHGQSGAIPLKHLVKLTGLSGREVRLMIERERRAGALIVSDNLHGYFIAANSSEVNCFVRSMRSRANEILKTADCVGKAAGIDRRI